MKTKREKLHAFLEREGATSLMNNTKWREVIQALLKLPLRYRVKLLMTDNMPDWTWLIYGHASAHYLELGSVGPITFFEVEWLEINTIEINRRGQLADDEMVDHTGEIEAILSSLGVPFSKDQAVIRIWGHLIKAGSNESAL